MKLKFMRPIISFRRAVDYALGDQNSILESQFLIWSS